MEGVVTPMQNKSTLTNYYYIDNIIEIKELLSSLDILYQNGILILDGIVNIDMIDRLKTYKINRKINTIHSGKNITFSLFPPKRLKLYTIAIEYIKNSKKLLEKLSETYVPHAEFCASLYYMDNEENIILEWNNVAEEAHLFISIEIPDEKVRRFCQSIDVNSYCTKFYSYS